MHILNLIIRICFHPGVYGTEGRKNYIYSVISRRIQNYWISGAGLETTLLVGPSWEWIAMELICLNE